MLSHLACIMDGNRRWAKKQGLAAFRGHRAGVDAVERVVRFCLDVRIPYLSLYTLSIENLQKRSAPEKEYLFSLITEYARKQVDKFIKDGIKIRFIGDVSLFPESVLSACTEIEKKTAQGTRLQVNFLFCYGARQELAQGIKTILRKIRAGMLTEDEITPEVLGNNMWMRDMPDPDLIIRTGGHKRLSNFLLFQAAYSDFHFFDCLWPDLTEEQLQQACATFNQGVRNFGI